MENKLPKFELLLYFIIWTLANFYALFELFKAQNDIFSKHDSLTYINLEEGWKTISRFKDVTDLEWHSWKYLYKTSWHYLLFQFAISELLRRKRPTCILHWYIISSLIYVTLHFGIKMLVLTLVMPLTFCLLLIFAPTKNVVWSAGIFTLYLYNSVKYKDFYWEYTDQENLVDEQVYLIFISFGWMELKCISYCLDYIERKNKEKDKIEEKNNKFMFSDLIEMFGYVLYLPMFLNGPLILHDDFKKSFHTSLPLQTRLKHFLKNQVLFSFYGFCLDLTLHYIYFLAMQDDIEVLREMPAIALCGGGLWTGLEFHLKYVVLYGTTSSLASLDNIKPPPNPRCIVRIHIYSEMWRYFDVGLYAFLIKYIYKPLMSNIDKYLKWSQASLKLLSSFLTFAFIFTWHGTTLAIFTWAVLNFIGITCEHLARLFYNSYIYQTFKKNVLRTEPMEQRFVAFICTPLLALSAISNFYLFTNYKLGNLFFERVSQPSFVSSITLFVSLYSCCHVSMALKDVPARTPGP